MIKNIIKRIIIFFIPFLIINNIYADEGLVLSYKYKTNDAEYVVTIKYSHLGYVEEQNVTKMDSNGASKPIPVTPLKNILNKGEHIYINYGISDCSISFDNYMYDMGYDAFMKDLKDNPGKYKPILRFDKSGNAIIIGSYFDSESFVETEQMSHNLNDNPDIIEKFLNGELTPIQGALLEKINFNEQLNVDKDRDSSYINSNSNSIDSGNKGNASYTKGTCEKYSMRLRNLKESIVGKNNRAGACSADSLKKIQTIGSLYDLKYNFDSSILEPKCKEFIYSGSGYINMINEAQVFYEGLKDEERNNMLCLLMESEYLDGLSVLTSYRPVVNIDESGCELINEKTLNFIMELFDAVKIAATGVCLLLCGLDIYKMTITKESDITKFRKVLIKRVVALVCLFLVPIIVNIVTDLINNKYIKSKCPDLLTKR